MKTRLTAMGLAVLCALSLAGPAMANKEKTYHTGAIVGTAATAYFLTHHQTKTGLIVGAASAYAWKRQHDLTKQRHQREAARRYRGRRVTHKHYRHAH